MIGSSPHEAHAPKVPPGARSISLAMPVKSGGWRTIVFKNRGALLVPVAIVLLVLGRPSAQSAAIGVAIAAAGEILRIWAVGYSGATTRADIVTAPALVTAGPYGMVRNPLYVANAIIALGFWFAFSGGVTTIEAALMFAVVLVLVVGVYAVIIPLEEAYLAGHFGEPYRRYLEAVPRVLPTGTKLSSAERVGTWRAEVIGHAEIITLAFFALMVGALYLKLGPWSALGVYF
jgi:protein-S-isoprenylcysteine O-methyltransferase Ste14